jgi:hypothetical protein
LEGARELWSEFSMLEKGRCKTKFPTFYEWYATLNVDQQRRVDKVLISGILRVRERVLSASYKSVCPEATTHPLLLPPP